MRVLITGHQGFIGRNLGPYLQHMGHEVEGYEYIENKVPDPKDYDRVVHLGAISSTTERDVEKVLKQNFSQHEIILVLDQEHELSIEELNDINLNINKLVKVTNSNRGKALNAGALKAENHYLWFLHIDSQINKKNTVEKNQLQKLNLPEGKLYHYTKGAKSGEDYNLSVNEYETICKSSSLSYSAYNQFVYSSIYPIARDVYRNGGAISNKKVYFNQNQKKCYAEFDLTGLYKGSQFKQNFMGTVVIFEYKKNSRSAWVHRMFPLGL